MNYRLLKPEAIMRLVRQYGDAMMGWQCAPEYSKEEDHAQALTIALEELIERRIRAALGESQ